jgi:hypothetical protein
VRHVQEYTAHVTQLDAGEAGAARAVLCRLLRLRLSQVVRSGARINGAERECTGTRDAAIHRTRPLHPGDVGVSGCANTRCWVLRDTARPCFGTAISCRKAAPLTHALTRWMHEQVPRDLERVQIVLRKLKHAADANADWCTLYEQVLSSVQDDVARCYDGGRLHV